MTKTKLLLLALVLFAAVALIALAAHARSISAYQGNLAVVHLVVDTGFGPHSIAERTRHHLPRFGELVGFREDLPKERVVDVRWGPTLTRWGSSSRERNIIYIILESAADELSDEAADFWACEEAEVDEVVDADPSGVTF